jgi:uncharacterized protein
MAPATDFTPLASLAGGALIGLAAVMLMLFNGRIAGISGILGRSLRPPFDTAWLGRIAFVAGLLAAPLLWRALRGAWPAQSVSSDLLLIGAAGLLVGLGTAIGAGCTSGHGVCGLARLSPRSLVATGVFMAVAIATVFVMRHAIGR